MRLKEKVRNGSKVIRRYDTPQTPYHRLLAHPELDNEAKAILRNQYEQLHFVHLKYQLDTLQDLLFRSSVEAGPPPHAPQKYYPPESHPLRGRAYGQEIVRMKANPQPRGLDSQEKKATLTSTLSAPAPNHHG